ncbi:hypothetical protein K1719_026507 [Acacia pycnantha]|nr:hypothetical protein K1719_026507 [Acacia pycnantha]
MEKNENSIIIHFNLGCEFEDTEASFSQSQKDTLLFCPPPRFPSEIKRKEKLRSSNNKIFWILVESESGLSPCSGLLFLVV